MVGSGAGSGAGAPVGELGWQPSLFGGGDDAPDIDESFAGRRRYGLSDGAWVDLVPGWLSGADALFDRLLANTPWQGPREVRMYERMVLEPRLTHRWVLTERSPVELAEPVLARMAGVLSARYAEQFTQVGVNLYRDGSDSVAWHGDRGSGLAGRGAAVPAAPDGRWPLGRADARPGGSAGPRRLLPAHLAARGAQGAQGRAADQRPVPARLPRLTQLDLYIA